MSAKHDLPVSFRKASSSKAAAGLAVQEVAASESDPVDKSFDELMTKRKSMAALAPGPPKDFGFRVRGGGFCEEKSGLQFDTLGAHARTSKAEEWCERFDLPMSWGTSVKSYTDEQAHNLSEEWCRKMQFFMDVWKSSGQEWEFRFADHVVGAYSEPESWAAWADAQPRGPSRSRVVQLRKLRPLLVAKSEEEVEVARAK